MDIKRGTKISEALEKEIEKSKCKVVGAKFNNEYTNLDYKIQTNGEIELVGLARGGLPLLVTISHLLNIRRISIIQTQMSNSDNCHDYGEVRYISDNLDDVKRNCILLEDIIYKGKTTNEAINIAKSKNKNVIGVYSLIIDEKFKTIEIENNDVPINYVYEILADHWIYFFWETDIRKMKEGGEIND